MMLEKRLGVGLMVYHEIDERHALIQTLKIAQCVLHGAGISFERRSTVGGEDHVRQDTERRRFRKRLGLENIQPGKPSNRGWLRAKSNINTANTRKSSTNHWRSFA